jgi:hypothetical protein
LCRYLWQLAVRETILLAPRNRPETDSGIGFGCVIKQRGAVMLWALIVSLILSYPLVEVVEGWLIRRSAVKKLAAMRKHAASGDRWDVARGQWTT